MYTIEVQQGVDKYIYECDNTLAISAFLAIYWAIWLLTTLHRQCEIIGPYPNEQIGFQKLEIVVNWYML